MGLLGLLNKPVPANGKSVPERSAGLALLAGLATAFVEVVRGICIVTLSQRKCRVPRAYIATRYAWRPRLKNAPRVNCMAQNGTYRVSTND